MFQFVEKFDVAKKPITYLKFSPNGKILFTGSEDGTACLWDIRNKESKIELSDKTLIYRFYFSKLERF
jgi:WD40 repeat protein